MQEIEKLAKLYNKTRVKLGLELASRLYIIENKQKDFPSYVEGLGLSYYSTRRLIGLYKRFIIEGGYTIDEISEIPYSKLEVIKPEKDLKKWINNAKSDITVKDLKILRKEEKVGNHKCEFERIEYKRCLICGLRSKF